MQAMYLHFGLFTNATSCTARLLIHELENPRSKIIDCVDEVCKLFEGGQYI